MKSIASAHFNKFKWKWYEKKWNFNEKCLCLRFGYLAKKKKNRKEAKKDKNIFKNEKIYNFNPIIISLNLKSCNWFLATRIGTFPNQKKKNNRKCLAQSVMMAIRNFFCTFFSLLFCINGKIVFTYCSPT